MTWREFVLALLVVAALVGVSFVDPIPQDALYHLFSDGRPFAGVPNFLNVASNLPFLFVGIAGIGFVRRQKAIRTAQMRFAWQVFFFGIAATAFGSGYYHLNPTNTSLFWDRLPMTIGFMSLVAIVVAEYFSVEYGKRLVALLLMLGVASVGYWTYTESLGRGDLRPYALVQFLPMLLLPLLLLFYSGRSDLQRYIWGMIGFYLGAKIFEYFDANVYNIGGIVSGHTIKHLLASVAPAYMLSGLRQRDRIEARADAISG